MSGMWSGAPISRRSSYIVVAIVYKRQTKDKRPQRSNVNARNLLQNSQYLWNIFFFRRSIWDFPFDVNVVLNLSIDSPSSMQDVCHMTLAPTSLLWLSGRASASNEKVIHRFHSCWEYWDFWFQAACLTDWKIIFLFYVSARRKCLRVTMYATVLIMVLLKKSSTPDTDRWFSFIFLRERKVESTIIS